MRVLNFYDDFLWATPKGQGKERSDWVKWFLPALGWKLNQKCVWQPSTEVDFLGFTINTTRHSLRVSEERIERVSAELKRIHEAKEFDTKRLESLTGQLVSMQPAIPVARLWTRGLYQAINEARDETIRPGEIDPTAKEEIQFWTQNIKTRNEAPIISGLCGA